MRRGIATAAFVIAAMGLGRLITDNVPLDNTAAEPFVRTGVIDRSVALEYADVTVTDARVTPTITGNPAATAGGRWLVVDTELVARSAPTVMLGFFVLDAKDRRYDPSNRGSDCSINASLATGVPTYATFCFDVPQIALAGARLVAARGPYTVNGSGFRRDDIADIDLGIAPSEVEALWSSKDSINVTTRGAVPPEKAAR